MTPISTQPSWWRPGAWYDATRDQLCFREHNRGMGLLALAASLAVLAFRTWEPRLTVASVLGIGSLAWLSFARAWTFDFRAGSFTGAIWFLIPVWRVSGSLSEIDLVELKQNWRADKDQRSPYWTLSIRCKGRILRVASDTSDCPGAVEAADHLANVIDCEVRFDPPRRPVGAS